MTGANQPCRLLGLPREIRDHIYDTLKTDHRISWTPRENRVIWLQHSTSKNVLLVNRQIHDEYMERVVPGRLFFINCGCDKISQEDLGIPGNFPARVLSQVQDAEIWIPYLDDDTREDPKIETFWEEAEDCAEPWALPWTPSKAMCDKLKTVLAQMQAVLHKKAKVRIWVHVDGIPDPSDKHQIGLSTNNYLAGAPNATVYRDIFDVQTYAELQTETTIPWPLPGNLGVHLALKTALFCVPEDKAAAEMSDDDQQRGQPPWITAERPWVQWSLRMTESEHNYMGYLPEFLFEQKGLVVNEEQQEEVHFWSSCAGGIRSN